MKDNRVSIIVPACNAVRFLARCLESILSQDLRPAQIIVINDGLTDNTTEIVGNYKDKYCTWNRQIKALQPQEIVDYKSQPVSMLLTARKQTKQVGCRGRKSV